jgi:hypothetical protein
VLLLLAVACRTPHPHMIDACRSMFECSRWLQLCDFAMAAACEGSKACRGTYTAEGLSAVVSVCSSSCNVMCGCSSILLVGRMVTLGVRFNTQGLGLRGHSRRAAA